MSKCLILVAIALITLSSTRLVNAQGLLYIVNTTSDTVVAGACANGNAGCSLRGAIQEANAHVGDDGIEIDLPAGSVINLTGALPDLTESVSISAAGPILPEVRRDTGGNYRIFNVTTTGTVFFSGLTISNGSVIDDLGGGIQNVFSATVTVTNCVLSDNHAEGSGNGNLGGGIANAGTGTVNVTNSTLNRNFANVGGGINNNLTGTVNVTGSGLSGNSAASGSGGGIANASSGTVNVSNSTFLSFNAGGGIGNNSTGTVNVINCTLNGNFGLGIFNADGTVNVTNSTLTGNSGGIANSTGLVTVINSTLSGNSANSGAGIFNNIGTMKVISSTVSRNVAQGANGDGGGIFNFNGTVIVESSLIALNSALSPTPDVLGDFDSVGFNLIGTRDGSTGFTTQPTDQTGTIASPLDPKLDPVGVQNNGGPTSTIALLPDSPAIDKGFNALTSLSSAVNNSTTAIDIADASSIPAGVGYTILIDSEQMVVTGKGGNTLTVTRAANGTTAASHSMGAILGSAFDQRGASFSRAFDDPAIPNASSDGTDIGAFEVQAPLPTPTPTPIPTTLGNISTRLRVETGDNVLIGGFIITGTQAKKVMVRAIAPSLPLVGVLADPSLELHDGAGTLITSNDNWMDAPNKQEIIDSTIAPTNDLESAILMSLDPGAYTAIVSGANNTTGIGLVEAYDLDLAADSILANISTRGLVQTGDNVMIGGFIILGSAPQDVLVRAIGPSLPLAGNLADPTLELHDGNGTLLSSNDNWRDTQETEIMATTIPPTDDAESAILQTLGEGAYTAIVRGVNNTTGVALVEVYALTP